MKNEPLNRHEIREKALQALFPLDFNADLSKTAAIEAALALDHDDLLSAEGDAFVPAYLDNLVSGVCQMRPQLDEYIQKNLKQNWTLNRLSKVDVAILRIALFEILYAEDVPAKVAVNEALELAKKYGDDASRKFINGVLSSVINEL